MNMRKVIILGLKIVLLTIVYLFIFMISAGLLSFGLPQPSDDQMAIALAASVLTSFVNVLVSAIIIRQSQWSGWRLAAAVGFSLYGVTTILTAIEAVYFAPALGINYSQILLMVPGLLLPTFVTLVIFMPFAVRILGRWRQVNEPQVEVVRAVMPAKQWAVKLLAIAVIYYLLYISFGFVVAWSNPNIREMYAAGANNVSLMVWGVIPLQFFRAMLWVLFALPVIRMSQAKNWYLALTVGLLYSLPMSIGLIMPNELMPNASARMSHFVEITISNFIFGLSVVWLLHRSHNSLRDLFGLEPTSEKLSQNEAKVEVG